MQFENQLSNEFADELFDLLPINSVLSDKLTLKPIEPNFQQYDSKDFFNLIGPIKVYTSENELSMPLSCILRKLPYQQTFGITVKGDCPVRINNVDKMSYAYSAGIREGDFIIAIQDQDVRWSKHMQVVEKIRSQTNSVKLTLVSVKPIPKEVPIFCEDQERNRIKNCSDTGKSTKESPVKFYSTGCFSTPQMNENHIWWANQADEPQSAAPKTPKLHQRFFRLPHSSSKTSILNLNSADSAITNAAQKLCNLARGASNSIKQIHVPDTVRLPASSKSVSNLNTAEKIQFNEEDDEICTREEENALFWQSLKNIKTPLTNTITLGRKFKKNVLKLNIFNSFLIPNQSAATCATISGPSEAKIVPTLPPTAPTSSSSSSKLGAKTSKILSTKKNKSKLNRLESQHLLAANSSSSPSTANKPIIYKTL